jgi:hypothetical protein
MAEFSKQYKDAIGFDWHDFDYEEDFNTLEPNQYIPRICEGFGTIAVAKSDNGEMLLAMPLEFDTESVEWIKLEDVIIKAKNI